MSAILSSQIFADTLEKLPTPALKTDADPTTNPDNWFFNYRLTNLAVETDELVQKAVGNDLNITENSLWVYPSYNSASIAFATSKNTITRVEYGENSYTHKTEISDSYYFNHLHYLKNLKENTTYHYRIIYQDASGQIRASADNTLVTKVFSNEIKLTNQDFPLHITNPGTYVLTEDITSNTLGINIKSNDVTIDLNGHTLIYDNGAPTATPDPNSGWIYVEGANMGIRAGLWNFVGTKVLNGTIKQGQQGTEGAIPLFLNHMGATVNEIAGLTIDYYSYSTPGMVTSNGAVHHNVLYDRGTGIRDRHMAIRALSAGTDSQVIFNSLRRFRHRGIDCGVNCEVANNEIYSDSYDTNSFAIGGGENHNIHDNKIFGLGYLFIGVGWGNGMTARDNLIYGRCYAPNMRSEEYGRPASVAGFRATNYYGEEFRDMLVENNTIVLTAEKSPDGSCNMARGLWVSNGTQDKANSLIYKNNTIKVEALPGNLDHNINSIFYNGDVNNALATVSVQGGGSTSEEIPNAIIFENNHLITNVNHIVIGEGYGIASGVRFYQTTLEKIAHDSEYFVPVRLGFWYWNTLENRLIDSKLVGFSESEMTPTFYGSTGKMDVSYGFTASPQFVDQYGQIIAGKTITARIDDQQTLQITTDQNGHASFTVITTKYYKYGNSQENDGVSGEPGQVDFNNYEFSLSGYENRSLTVGELRNANAIILQNLTTVDDDLVADDGNNNNNNNNDDDNNNNNNASNDKTTVPKEIAATGLTFYGIIAAPIIGLSAYATSLFLHNRKLK
jgi:hypothetical protein